jgi:hypothetical protein
MSTLPSPDSPSTEVSRSEEETLVEHQPRSPSPSGRPASRHWLSLIIVVVLAIAIVVPPLFNIESYQRRIAANISRSLGRPVHFAHITLHLLPRPGFDLTDFTVEEGPGFGPEPILHSSSVSASVRLLSLWRGRLEIARIALDEPSLNLVRNAAGRWNFASVMTQASLTTVAPTGQVAPGRTLRFPYIEASNARINFKYGDEKQPFSFLNGDLSIWLENPEEWQLRFAAQPVRTDLDLFASNTGLVRIEGSMKRAPMLGEIPLNLRAEWTHAPLGQIGRLFGGEDPGWRGELDLDASLTGTPTALLLNTSMTLDNLHRVEFQPDHALTYAAKCTGTYRKAEGILGDLSCLVPVGDGKIQVVGAIGSPRQPEQTRLEVNLLQVPASAVLDFVRLTRQKLGQDLAVGGQVNGQFRLGVGRKHITLAGSAATEELTLTAPSLSKPLSLSGIRLTALDSGRDAARGQGNAAASLLLAPVKIDFGAPIPLLVDGRFDRRGFLLHFGGRAELARLIPSMRSIGMADPGLQQLQPTGEATLDVQLRGPWLLPVDAYGATSDSGSTPFLSAPTGTITLRDARLETSYLAAPLAIKSAQASLLATQGAGAQIVWSGIVAQYGSVHFTGTFRASLPCSPGGSAGVSAPDGVCTRQFDITVPTLDIGALPGLLAGNNPLMRTLLNHIESNPSGTDWPPLHGTLRAATASLGTLSLEDAVASLDMKGSQMKIESLDAKALDGTLHVSGTVDAGSTPTYRLDAQLNQASVASLGQMFRQAWGTGTINVATHLTLTGSSKDDLMSSAQGMFHFDWSHGGLHAPAAVGTIAASNAVGARLSPLRSPFARFDQWTADGQVQDSGLTLEQSLLTGPDGARAVQGTIGFGTQLDLKLAASPASSEPDVSASGTSSTSPTQAGALTGTLAAPEFSLTQP